MKTFLVRPFPRPEIVIKIMFGSTLDRQPADIITGSGDNLGKLIGIRLVRSPFFDHGYTGKFIRMFPNGKMLGIKEELRQIHETTA